jgi:hypothetical protein
MGAPRFSILIPTRQRASTLRYAIQSVLQQRGFDDYEVLVQDNCSSEETARVACSFDSQRVRYNRSDSPLPMHINWEQGLGHCRGEYLMVLGDDDALMPDCMALAAPILSRTRADVLHWQKHTYWWNDAIRKELCGMLFLNYGHDLRPLDREKMLSGFFAWQVGFGDLPDAYSSFVHRSVIDSVIRASGTYFGPPMPCRPCAPDIYSGIANLAAARNLVLFGRGLSISGNSGASTGTAHVYRKQGESVRKRYYADEGLPPNEPTHPALILTSNLEVGIASNMLLAKERLFHSDPDCQVDLKLALAAMALNINRDPDGYDDCREDIFRFADKIGVARDEVRIPPQAPRQPPLAQGPLCTPDGHFAGLAVNCRDAGINDAAAAALLASGLLPKLNIEFTPTIREPAPLPNVPSAG